MEDEGNIIGATERSLIIFRSEDTIHPRDSDEGAYRPYQKKIWKNILNKCGQFSRN